uniref:Secreted protein n=1 Tax=Zonotrichia albicollis TaxID=44394 RepID=A0A8D2LYB9_ZONAL
MLRKGKKKIIILPTLLHSLGTGSSRQGQCMEQTEEDQPIVLIPDPSTPQREASVGPILTCNCSSSPCRAGAELSGFRRQKKTKGG